MAIESNFLLVSGATDRLMELNNDASDFSLAIEGGDLRSPQSVACVSEILCLVGNNMGSNVVAVNLRGEVMGVFAQVGNPLGLLHVKHLNLLAVVSFSGDGYVYLFDLADLNLEQPLQVSPLPPPPSTPPLRANSSPILYTCRKATPTRRSSCRRPTANPGTSASENTTRSCLSRPWAARSSAAASRARVVTRKTGTP
jgi:hypothetical protein